MKNTGRILLFLIAIGLLFITADKSWVLAQDENEPTGFKNVRLWIYPEYDDPRLLVMLEGQIEGVSAPVEVRFLVPSIAEMYAAGSMDAQGRYSGGPPDREPSSILGWDEISYEVTTDTFRVEYYAPVIIGQADKTISYEFRPLYPISELGVVLQEPRLSSNFSVIPAGKAVVDDQGFNFYLYNYSELDDGSSVNFEIAYTKSDTRPSLAIEDNGTASPLLAVIVIIILGVGIVGAFFWIRKSRPSTRAARRQLSRNAAARRSNSARNKGRFCSQCGERIENSNKFCSHCGAEL